MDAVLLSNIPANMTYDKLINIVEPFGDISLFNWDSSEPERAEVIYEHPSCAKDAVHFLDNSIIEGNEILLSATLRSGQLTTLFVGDLTPDVTEPMLELAFTSIVQSRVRAKLKRDSSTNSSIGYGFLIFEHETAANQALVLGNRIKVGNANVRLGHAERNTFLYVTELDSDTEISDVHELFGKYGRLVLEDTVIIRRSYAFVRFQDRNSAERAKRALDRTDLCGRLTVRYAEADQGRNTVQVRFHSSIQQPPTSLKSLLFNSFSKYGSCSVEIPQSLNGLWRRVAFIHYHGEYYSAALAAASAIQNIKYVSFMPVHCQFAKVLVPRVPPEVAVYKGTSSNSLKGSFPAEFHRNYIVKGKHQNNNDATQGHWNRKQPFFVSGNGTFYPERQHWYESYMDATSADAENVFPYEAPRYIYRGPSTEKDVPNGYRCPAQLVSSPQCFTDDIHSSDTRPFVHRCVPPFPLAMMGVMPPTGQPAYGLHETSSGTCQYMT